MSLYQRVCPDCGDFRFGSYTNPDGTMTRLCHGHIVTEDGRVLNGTVSLKTLSRMVHEEAIRTARNPSLPFRYQLENCKRTWHQSEDEANGIRDEPYTIPMSAVHRTKAED